MSSRDSLPVAELAKLDSILPKELADLTPEEKAFLDAHQDCLRPQEVEKFYNNVPTEPTVPEHPLTAKQEKAAKLAAKEADEDEAHKGK